MIKSTIVAFLAFATVATVSAQTSGMPDHIAFTQPVGEGSSYAPGTNQTFSWSGACVPPSTLTSPNPTQAKVELVDSTNSENAVFRKDVITIDCTASVGNQRWVVPSDLDPSAKYSLQIVLTPKNAYSGKFTIVPKDAAPSNGSGDDAKPTGAASSLAPATLTAVATAAGALFLF